jgi:Notch-like protein
MNCYKNVLVESELKIKLKYDILYYIQMETQSKQLEQVLSPPPTDMDNRQWTPRHLNAANIPNEQMALTPPYDSEHTHVNDVDVRGPGGFTPLMLASFRGNGLDTGCDNESSGSGSGESSNSGDSDDKSVEVIQALLVQGAEINAQTDRTGINSALGGENFILVLVFLLIINVTIQNNFGNGNV